MTIQKVRSGTSDGPASFWKPCLPDTVLTPQVFRGIYLEKRKMSGFWGTGGLLSKVSGFISSVDVKIKTPSSAEKEAPIPGGSLVAR